MFESALKDVPRLCYLSGTSFNQSDTPMNVYNWVIIRGAYIHTSVQYANEAGVLNDRCHYKDVSH